MSTFSAIRLRPRTGFTLIELLVVIAIIAILAAILFPVFAQAKAQAKRAACLSNAKQMTLGILMYTNDSDDHMVPSDTGGAELTGFGFGHPDHVWGELIYPYVKNYDIARCPMDPNATDSALSINPVDQKTPIGPSDPNYYYAWLERTDLGLNYTFLAPWYLDFSSNPWTIGSKPINMSIDQTPAKTLALVDSVWDRDTQTGAPYGGGNWVVEAPCVFDTNRNFLPPIALGTMWDNGGWIQNPTEQPPYSWLEFGGVWPRHANTANSTFVDGHAHNETVGALAAGCSSLFEQDGDVTDFSKYLWSNQ